MRRPLLSCALLAVMAVAALSAGCAARQQSAGLVGKLVRGADGLGGIAWPADPEAPAAGNPGPVPARAEPAPGPRMKHDARDAELVEVSNTGLRAALAAAEASPGPEGLRAVAAEYRRLGLFDQAHRYLVRALAVKPDDGLTLDALARLWRDWGVPSEGLGDAYRAVAATPEAPHAHNTLGTVLFALGQIEAAEARFEHAFALDGSAAWAQSNLCYAAFMRGDEFGAIGHCREALRIDPAFRAARNNLALVHAAAGRWDEARDEFLAAAAGEAEGVGWYNLGIAFLAEREYARATGAFETAIARQPGLWQAYGRAKDARRLARTQ